MITVTLHYNPKRCINFKYFLVSKTSTTWMRLIFRYEPLKGWAIIVNKFGKKKYLNLKSAVFGSLKLMQSCGTITVNWRLTNAVLWLSFILASNGKCKFIWVIFASNRNFRVGFWKELKFQISPRIHLWFAPHTSSPVIVHWEVVERLCGKHYWRTLGVHSIFPWYM